MSDKIRDKIWELLSGKDVSLAMIYNRDGEILWNRGRRIAGDNVHFGLGFSRSYILKSLSKPDFIHQENIVVDSLTDPISESAKELRIGSLLIQPLERGIYLYVDSGVKKSFSDADVEVFRVLGELVGDLISRIYGKGSDFGLAGDSPQIARTRDLILKYSLEEEPVLIIGETGSGKSRIAEALHRGSEREGMFVTANIPCIPPHLFESELFGYKKGAFTDARTDKLGLIDEAAGGTLFLDEVSEVPFSVQAKLLRLIDTRKYSILGENHERLADVRFIAATNRDLAQAIRDKEFREDLYFRLHTLEMKIPPLRERREDIPDLVVQKSVLLKGKKPGEGFFEALMLHDWPGNVRELITVLTRAGIHGSETIDGKEIGEFIRQSHYSPQVSEGDSTEGLWREIESGGDFWKVLWQPFIDRDFDRSKVRAVLSRAYKESGGSFKKMIALLHIDESEYHTFMSLMYRYDIDPRK